MAEMQIVKLFILKRFFFAGDFNRNLRTAKKF